MIDPSQKQHPSGTPATGFTLIELLIVIAIMGFLAAITYPSYVAHVSKGYRSSGQQFLTIVSQTEEQYFNDARSYVSSLATLGMSLPAEVAANYSSPTITINAAGARASFVATLVPTSTGPMAADGPLVVNSQGQRWRSCTAGCSSSPDSCTYNAAVDKRWDDSSKC